MINTKNTKKQLANFSIYNFSNRWSALSHVNSASYPSQVKKLLTHTVSLASSHRDICQAQKVTCMLQFL